jgi:hypothetical protein
VREHRIGAETARKWLEMRLAGQGRGGRFAVDASGPLRAARYGTQPVDEYEALFPTPRQAADRYWSVREVAAARAADLGDDELHDLLFGDTGS